MAELETAAQWLLLSVLWAETCAGLVWMALRDRG